MLSEVFRTGCHIECKFNLNFNCWILASSSHPSHSTGKSRVGSGILARVQWNYVPSGKFDSSRNWALRDSQSTSTINWLDLSLAQLFVIFKTSCLVDYNVTPGPSWTVKDKKISSFQLALKSFLVVVVLLMVK